MQIESTVNGVAVQVPGDSAGNLTPAPLRGALTDRSGTVTAGGASQQLCAANAARKYLYVQNNSTGDLWVNWTTVAAASQPSQKIPAGGAYSWPDAGFISTEAVNIIGASTGQAFTAKEG